MVQKIYQLLRNMQILGISQETCVYGPENIATAEEYANFRHFSQATYVLWSRKCSKCNGSPLLDV